MRLALLAAFISGAGLLAGCAAVQGLMEGLATPLSPTDSRPIAQVATETALTGGSNLGAGAIGALVGAAVTALAGKGKKTEEKPS